jgi:uncharacterized repeat protein (TIGR03803 family)
MATLTTLINFTGANGAQPTGSLYVDGAGDLIGTTALAGPNGGGTVFEIPYTDGAYASTSTALVSFNGSDGAYPYYSGVISDAAGDLFGVTSAGGASGHGVVFEIPYTDGSYATTPTTLVSFDSTDGSTPEANLLMNAAGDLFGTTTTGGAFGQGTIFEVPYTDGSYASAPTVLVNFNSVDGSAPGSALVADANGDLFGTTETGGAYNEGTVFEIPYTDGSYASTPTILVTFEGTNGNPALASGLLIDSAGDLFGTTATLGTDQAGTVFEIPYVDGSYASTPTTLINFNYTDGWAGTLGSLVADANGDLFGTTQAGGEFNDGTVFEIPYVDGSYASTPDTLITFDGTNGQSPLGSVTFDSAGNLVGTTRLGGTDNDGTVFEVVICFLAGTRIATPAGEVAVECLAVGDMVTTLHGMARRIVWIGQGRVMATRGRRSAATPVIVRKGALAENVPHRNLRVTKAHALYIDDVLIPVEFLVNHRSIVWDDRAQEVTVYHVELETHDILIADGAPAESYRDDGNRWLFQNANTGWALPPQYPCAPLLTGGSLVDAIWSRLLDRAGPRNSVPLTDDADLHVVMDGRRLDLSEHAGDSYVFRLPTVPAALRIASRAAVPAELGLARDPRPLGVALRLLVVRQGSRFRTVAADDARLIQGFHAFELDNGFRWTDGDAIVPTELFAGFAGPIELVLKIGMTGRYVDQGQTRWAA